MVTAAFRALLYAIHLLVALTVLASGASAGADDGTVAHEGEGPSLYLTAGDVCEEDYAGELSTAGYTVKVSKFRSLESIARFAGVPRDVELTHMLLAGGYVIVNHVSPDAIVRLLSEKPKVTGLIGSSECAVTGNHDQIHAQSARPF